MSNITANTIDEYEVAKFTAIADEWWDLDGKFKPLHKFNPVRIEYVRDVIAAHFNKGGNKPLSGLDIIDVGCGGGLLAEPMCRLGANVTAIDASEKNIKVASVHSENNGLNIDYQATSVEQVADTGRQFDVVMAMEIVEHVADIELFINSCCKLVKPGGMIFMATMNRTVKSYMLAIVGAEYILKWLPKNTHDWKKFLQPSEIDYYYRKNMLQLEQVQGVTFNPLNQKWSLSDDTKVNYIIHAVNK